MYIISRLYYNRERERDREREREREGGKNLREFISIETKRNYPCAAENAEKM